MKVSSLPTFLLTTGVSTITYQSASVNANHPLRYRDNTEADDHHAAAVEDDKQRALQESLCSCSPLEYNFILNLDNNCETNDIDGQPGPGDGIGLTFCFLGVSSSPSCEDARRNHRRLRNTNTNKNHRILSELQLEDPNSDELTVEQQQQQQQQQQQHIRFLAEDIEIISIQFLEFDTSGELIVINQDDSYCDASLADGSVVTFESIANNLDPNVPITDQFDFLPGGVQVILRGRVTDEVTGDTRIITNRITWSYTNACDVWPVLESGESIGWITNGDLTPASQAFCPAAPVPPTTTTTTTEAPPTTTTTTEEVTTTTSVTTTSMAKRSAPSQCTDGDNYFSEILYPASFPDGCGGFGTDPDTLCNPTVCPGVDVVLGRTYPFQRQDDFPGNYPLEPRGNSLGVPQITSTYEFWVDGKKDETLQCFKSKGYNSNEDVSEDGVQTTSTRGHIALQFVDYEPFVTYKFSGLNPNNIKAPGLYYMQGGESSYTFSSSNETVVFDYTKITGKFVDVCEELKAALEGGGGGEEDTCAGKAENVCKKDDNCMWKRKKGGKCVPMPWK